MEGPQSGVVSTSRGATASKGREEEASTRCRGTRDKGQLWGGSVPPKLLRHSQQNEKSCGSALQEAKEDPGWDWEAPRVCGVMVESVWCVVGVGNPSQSLGKLEAVRAFFFSFLVDEA